MESVLISIRPEWCELIASGRKTIEVRKTRPKIAAPFKCYIYCTKTGRLLFDGNIIAGGNRKDKIFTPRGITKSDALDLWDANNGKVIGEWVCDRIDRLVRVGGCCDEPHYCSCGPDLYTKPIDNLCAASCLTPTEIERYLAGGVGYGWHISDVVIYDKPKELSEFWAERICERGAEREDCTGCWDCEKRPPQSWRYVEELS